ncbi:hypothetical protein JW998_15670 [candidate division KSB1 bacterium]|nr:hypothetical protein [candidate division KSB1 bacterium]
MSFPCLAGSQLPRHNNWGDGSYDDDLKKGQMMKKEIGILCLLFFLHSAKGQDRHFIPHLQRTANSVQLIVDGKPFIMLAGEVHNSSSSSLDYMEKFVWPELVALRCNTAIVSISWELFEPREGEFDTAIVDSLIRSAREYQLKLVIIWFASWKNGESTYVPALVKQDTKRFPRAMTRSGEPMRSLSALGAESCAADARAFAALIARIREIDENDGTVMLSHVCLFTFHSSECLKDC